MTGLRPKKDGLVVSHIMHTLLNRLVLLAVIAGTASIDPLSSLIILGADDGKVAVGNTKVTGMQDHLTVAASHTFFPQNQEVQAQTLFFKGTAYLLGRRQPGDRATNCARGI